MAENLMPTHADTVPGMVTLKHIKSGTYVNHFPVDVREIMTTSPGEYEMVNNGAAEASRLNVHSLQMLGQDKSLVRANVVGIEGMVAVSMTEDEHNAWIKLQADRHRETLPELKPEAVNKDGQPAKPEDVNKDGQPAKPEDVKAEAEKAAVAKK